MTTPEEFRTSVGQAVILAAGDGGRMGSLTTTCPKPLLSVHDQTLIEYPIRHLVQAGITRIVVVTGFMGERVRERLGDGSRFGAEIMYAENLRYHEGNAVSLAAAAPLLADAPYLLLMADHLIDVAIIRTLLAVSSELNHLAVDVADQADPRADEATRVLVKDDGFIRSIGKGLPMWNALDTGAFLLQPATIEMLSRKDYQEISEVMNDVIASGAGLRACDVTGSFWFDVDTPQDLAAVSQALRADATTLV